MIYYVRHGQTNGNVKKLFIDDFEPLNENGINQAKETAKKLKDEKFDIIFCSPLLRTRQTLKEIAKYHKDTPVVFDERLKERGNGDLDGFPLEGHDPQRWNLNEPYKEGTGETIEASFARVKNFYDEVFEKYPDQKVLVVSHAGIGKLTMCYFNGFPEDGNIYDYRISNAEVVIFDKKK